MDTRLNIVASRRGFISTILGLMPGILLADPKRLGAARPEIKNILSQIEWEILQSSKFKRDSSVICRTFGGTSTLCRGRGKKREILCRMNQMGKIIWEACDGRKNLQDISKLIHEKYLVSMRQATVDTFAFLKSLKEIGAIL
jgi:hypothetical protein